jgi:ABC-type protease/lipase transport system fused ATPase/permease subunit
MLMPSIRLNIVPPPQTPLQAALWTCAGPLGLVFAYSCGYNLLLFAPSIYLLQIYDRVLSSHSIDTLLMLTLIVALTVVVGSVLDALRRAILGRLAAWFEDRLRPSVLSASLEYAFRAHRTSIGILPFCANSSNPALARCCLTRSGRLSFS